MIIMLITVAVALGGVWWLEAHPSNPHEEEVDYILSEEKKRAREEAKMRKYPYTSGLILRRLR